MLSVTPSQQHVCTALLPLPRQPVRGSQIGVCCSQCETIYCHTVYQQQAEIKGLATVPGFHTGIEASTVSYPKT